MELLKTILISTLISMSSLVVAGDQWLKVEMTIQPIKRSFEGHVEAIMHATVSAQTSGRVAEIHYDVDDFVAADSVLIEFTNTEQKLAVKRAQANLESAKATEQEATAHFNRIKTTYDRKLISQSDFDMALTRKNTATATVKAQHASLENALTQLEYTLVKAPFDGIVTTRHIEIGETVDTGMPVMSGLSLDHLRVISHIPESLVNPIKQISLAQIKLPGNAVIESADITVFPYADSQSRTFEFRVNLPERTPDLFPGMSTAVSFNMSSKEMILIPQDAIVRRGELTLVYVKHENKRLPRQIITGQVYNHQVEIVSGLKPGEYIDSKPMSENTAININNAIDQL